ncbi:MAG: hypothetical protein COS85_22330, partial [Armatimonadetes bacterium CG07_land_8_20_14_0_80_59_28]
QPTSLLLSIHKAPQLPLLLRRVDQGCVIRGSTRRFWQRNSIPGVEEAFTNLQDAALVLADH